MMTEYVQWSRCYVKSLAQPICNIAYLVNPYPAEYMISNLFLKLPGWLNAARISCMLSGHEHCMFALQSTNFKFTTINKSVGDLQNSNK